MRFPGPSTLARVDLWGNIWASWAKWLPNVCKSDQVAEKLIHVSWGFRLGPFHAPSTAWFYASWSSSEAIELFGTQVAPKIRAYFAMKRSYKFNQLSRLVRAYSSAIGGSGTRDRTILSSGIYTSLYQVQDKIIKKTFRLEVVFLYSPESDILWLV